MIDFNLPAIATKTVAYDLLNYRWRTHGDVTRHRHVARVINLGNAAENLRGTGRCGFFELLDEAQVNIHRQLKYS